MLLVKEKGHIFMWAHFMILGQQRIHFFGVFE